MHYLGGGGRIKLKFFDWSNPKSTFNGTLSVKAGERIDKSTEAITFSNIVEGNNGSKY